MQRVGETDRREDGEDKLSIATLLRRVGGEGVLTTVTQQPQGQWAALSH